MSTLLYILFSGLVTGAVYAIFALGLSLVYSTARVLNFGYGSLYMVAAYLAYALGTHLGLGYVAIVPLVLGVMFLLGVLLEVAMIRPLRKHPNWKMATMMASLGLALVLDNLMLVIFGPQQRQIPLLFDGAFEVGELLITHQDLAVLLIAATTVLALELFLKFMPLGQAMRAVSQDMEGARMVGIRVNRVFACALGLSAVLAGVAALLLTPVTLISPQGGWTLFLKAFVIVVFGGLGSTRGALIAAILLGVIESLVVYQFGATWIMPVWLLVLLIVLMVRPKGLFGVWAA
ncbi:branched-chain amino acid ABC transporter permease [Pseudomonas aeruginosa]|uniref:branched-chain amino acid ABC transporter permease n=1 Tax=Pseudomonas aeruginosa TaxID=287 RepID=UPI003523AA69